MTPVTDGIQIAERKNIAAAGFDIGDGLGNFAGNEILAAQRAFMVE